MVNIAVFASGSGTNAAALADFFNSGKRARVAIVVTNNPDAGVIHRAIGREIPVAIIENSELRSDELRAELKKRDIGLILLAGFLQKIPPELIREFPNRILNIHPALLPDFGGKGMYGKRVHTAVSESGKTTSGITVHLINEEYDKGEIVFQKKVNIEPGESAESIEKKVRKLELQHYPEAVNEFLEQLVAEEN